MMLLFDLVLRACVRAVLPVQVSHPILRYTPRVGSLLRRAVRVLN
jgi:hypothetical protein